MKNQVFPIFIQGVAKIHWEISRICLQKYLLKETLLLLTNGNDAIIYSLEAIEQFITKKKVQVTNNYFILMISCVYYSCVKFSN